MPTMNESARSLPISQLPTPAEADRVVTEARQLFQRTLSAWVCDLLELRRAGLDRPGWVTDDDETRWHEAA